MYLKGVSFMEYPVYPWIFGSEGLWQWRCIWSKPVAYEHHWRRTVTQAQQAATGSTSPTLWLLSAHVLWVFMLVAVPILTVLSLGLSLLLPLNSECTSQHWSCQSLVHNSKLCFVCPSAGGVEAQSHNSR